MADLKTLYEELMCSPEKWQYYDGGYERFDNLFYCKDYDFFIKDTLKKGEKADLGVFANSIDKLSTLRKRHIVSCYFLGILIYNNDEWIRKLIDKQIKSLNSNVTGEKPNKKFCYLWMLICLFHDLGYAIEEYSSDDKTIKDIPEDIPCKPKGIVPKIYDKTLLRNYWLYRRCRWQLVDHGIIGGLRFYNDICDLRKQMDKNPNKEHCWDVKLEKDFACAAWIIICHNIFTTKEGSEYECCYRHYKLNKLITNEYFIKAEKHPLLFLFCLVDSIEPIKVLGDYSYFEEIDRTLMNMTKLS